MALHLRVSTHRIPTVRSRVLPPQTVVSITAIAAHATTILPVAATATISVATTTASRHRRHRRAVLIDSHRRRAAVRTDSHRVAAATDRARCHRVVAIVAHQAAHHRAAHREVTHQAAVAAVREALHLHEDSKFRGV